MSQLWLSAGLACPAEVGNDAVSFLRVPLRIQRIQPKPSTPARSTHWSAHTRRLPLLLLPLLLLPLLLLPLADDPRSVLIRVRLDRVPVRAEL